MKVLSPLILSGLTNRKFDRQHHVDVVDSNYTITKTDIVVAVRSITGLRTLSLPAISTCPEQILWVIDYSGQVSTTNTVQILANGTDQIQDGSTYDMMSPFGAVCLRNDGVGIWSVLSANDISSAVKKPILRTTASYTVTGVDSTIICDATNNSIAIFLPANPVVGHYVTIKKTDSTSHSITVDGNGKQIDGLSSVIISNQYVSYVLQYDGLVWNIL